MKKLHKVQTRIPFEKLKITRLGHESRMYIRGGGTRSASGGAGGGGSRSGGSHVGDPVDGTEPVTISTTNDSV